MSWGTILLKCGLACAIAVLAPGKYIILQDGQIYMLVDLDPFRHEVEGRLEAVARHTCPDYNRGWLLVLEWCTRLQGDAFLALGQNAVILAVVDGLDNEDLLVSLENWATHA